MILAEAQAILQAVEILAPLGEQLVSGVKDLLTHHYSTDSWTALEAQCQLNIATTKARMEGLHSPGVIAAPSATPSTTTSPAGVPSATKSSS